MSATLGHRERLLRSLEYRDIDRPPAFFRADLCVRQRLCADLGLKDEAALIGHFGADAIHIGVPYRKDLLRQTAEPDTFYDIFGNKVRSMRYGDIRSEVVVEPVLTGAVDIDDIHAISWPGRGLLDLERAEKESRTARETGLAVYGGVWASIFSHSRFMVGEEEYLTSLVTRPDFICCLLDRITDCFIEMNDAYLSACAQYLDIYYFGSDFGTQDSMFISAEMFSRLFNKSLKRIIEHAKSFGLKVMYHTCGSVREIIPELIESGVEILDPVQVSAKNMSAANLAEAHKGEICFHGGISTQKTLPLANPEEIRHEVKNTIDRLGPLGYVVSPDQELISDVPTENIEAMFRAVIDYRC
ncbi:uroporphyrinogen decarboxylase family protein [Gemmatimonadota bacterium]